MSVPSQRLPSCAECTRLKKKCSRVWPCDQCVKRGCANLCPDESSNPSRIGKSIVQQMEALKAENRRLAETLASLSINQSSHQIIKDVHLGQAEDSDTRPDPPPQVISQEVLSVDNNNFQSCHDISASDDNDTDHYHASGTTSTSTTAMTTAVESLLILHKVTSEDLPEQGSIVHDADASSSYLGRGAGAMHLLDQEQSPRGRSRGHLTCTGILPWHSGSVLSGKDISNFLPTIDVARDRIRSYYDGVDWMYRPIEESTANEILESTYGTGDIQHPSKEPHPHQLAVLLLMLAMGQRFQNLDNGNDRSFDSLELSSRLLFGGKDNVMIRPTHTACQALHLMISFLFIIGDEDDSKAAWPLLGLQLRLCQSLGLHRGNTQTSKSASLLWWESYTYDLLQSLNFGRPYSTPIHFVTCPKPQSITTHGLGTSTEPQILEDAFHNLKYAMAEVFGKVADCLSSCELPSQQTVNALDRELRDLENNAPPWLKFGEWVSFPGERNTIPQRHMVALLKDKALLALHRPLFAKALKCLPEPLSGPYAASFIACISAARRHTSVMQSILEACPKAAYNWWFFSFHAFTGAVIQATVLLYSPGSIMKDDVRSSFASSIRIFTTMAPSSIFASRALPILLGLRSKIETGCEANFMTTDSARSSVFNHTNAPLDYNSQLTDVMNGPFQSDYIGMGTTDSLAQLGDVQHIMPALDWMMDPTLQKPEGLRTEDPLMQTLSYWIPNTTMDCDISDLGLF